MNIIKRKKTRKEIKRKQKEKKLLKLTEKRSNESEISVELSKTLKKLGDVTTAIQALGFMHPSILGIFTPYEDTFIKDKIKEIRK